ncbi:MAG: hypothetical protein R3330_02675 [Saprospiraceae bacterium]|nr:hypothetical protein [Saprospiraceae bacterium]
MHTYFLPMLALLLVSNADAQIQKLTITSDGIALNAYMYQAPGEEAKPTIIWCHGNPGRPVTGDSEFAQRLNGHGINVLRWNYRGLWGTDGTYTPGNCQRDLQHVIDFVFDAQNSARFRIDTNRIIVAGYSHGSNVTLVSALYDERIREVFCLGLADFSYLSRETFNPANAGMRKFNQDVKDAIWGANEGPGTYAPDYDKYVLDILFNNYKYDFVANGDLLHNKRLFIVVGMNDVTVPIEHHFFPLYRKLMDMEHEDFRYEITGSDHGFAELYDGQLSTWIAGWIHER